MVTNSDKTAKSAEPENSIQWNKKGTFFQVITCCVYGAIKLNRAAFLSTDSGRWGADHVARKKGIMSKKIKRFFSRNKQRKSIKTWPKEFNIGEKERPLLATMTGEPFQLVRIHYDLSCKKTIEGVFVKMKCMDFDQNLNRWVWNFYAEAKKIKLKSSYNDIPKQHRPIVIGSFFKNGVGPR